MHLNVIFLDVTGFTGQIDCQIRRINSEVLFQLLQRDTAQIDVIPVVGGKEVLIPQRRFIVCQRIADSASFSP